jgi:ubiquinone/menaquinone biosynthesis methyltransferase
MDETIVLIKNKKAVPKAFNRIAKHYDFATGMSQGYQSDLDRSAGLLQLKGDEWILDCCCGTGKSSASVLPFIKTGKIIGIDNSEGMLEEARKKFYPEMVAGKLEFQLQDAMELNFLPQTFDAIFVAYGLRNMPDYQNYIRQLFGLLKPGGKLVIHDYSLANTWYAKPLWGILGWGFIVPFCTIVSGSSKIFRYLIKSVFSFLRPNEVVELLSANGFTKVSAQPHKGWRAPILHAFYAEKAE